MTHKQYKWLLSEMEKWQEKELVDEHINRKIEAYYAEEKIIQSIKLGAILGALGIILIGLGIILILAKNWDYFPRMWKAGISLLPFCLGSIGGIVVLQKKGSRWLKEGMAIFTTLGILTALAMNGQIYHSVAEAWVLYMSVALLSLPLIYLYDSTLTLGAYLALETLCMFENNLEGRLLIGLLMIGAVLPYIIKSYKKSPYSISTCWRNGFVALAGFGYITSMLGSTIVLRELYLLYFISLLVIDAFLYEPHLVFTIRPFAIIGNLGLYLTLFILTFNNLWDGNSTSTVGKVQMMMTGLLLTGIIGGIVWLVKNKKDFTKKIFIYTGIGIFIIGFRVFGIMDTNTIILLPIVLNILFVFLGISVLREGIAYSSIGKMNRGLLLLGSLIVARFFDSEISFLVKGFVFILCGIIFLLVNFYIGKKRVKELTHHAD